MLPTLYYFEANPAVRSVLLTSQALGMNLVLKPIKILEKDNALPEFLKLKPQHTVPTLVDKDGFTIWDSHAINAYLIGKYGKNDSLYPKDPQKRAVIDQRLHFNSGILFSRLDPIIREIFLEDFKQLSKYQEGNIDEIYAILETFFTSENEPYIAGKNLTIADFSLVASVSTLNALTPISSNKYPKIQKWLTKMEALPYYQTANQNGLDIFTNTFKKRLHKLQNH